MSSGIGFLCDMGNISFQLVGLSPVLTDVEVSIELAFEVEVVLGFTHGILKCLTDVIRLIWRAGDLRLIVNPSMPLDIETTLDEQFVSLQQPLFAQQGPCGLQEKIEA